MRKMLFALLAMAVLAFTAPWAEAATPREAAHEMALKAADLLAQQGKEKAYATFHDRNGGFFTGELYVFVINLQGAWEAYGPQPSAVGTSLVNLKDVDGKEFIRDMISLAKEKGEGWVDYKWKNPETGKIQEKTTFIKRVGDVFVGVGVYK